MTPPGESDGTTIVVIERNDQNWLYVDEDGHFLQAEKRGDGISFIVGYKGISEEPEHDVTLPGPVTASLLEWIRR